MLLLGRAGKKQKAPKLSALFSAATDEWPTAGHVVEALRRRGFIFTLDAAADAKNAKAPRFYTQEKNALVQRWCDDAEGGDVWCNPPYSIIGGSSADHDDTHGFVEKAIAEVAGGLRSVVFLLPVRSCRLWFHRLLALQPTATNLRKDAVVVAGRAAGVTTEFIFVLGRMRFGAATTDAPFPSVVVVVRGQRQ